MSLRAPLPENLKSVMAEEIDEAFRHGRLAERCNRIYRRLGGK